METVDLAWALSIERLIELTARDGRRVVRPVSPQIAIRPRVVFAGGERAEPPRAKKRSR